MNFDPANEQVTIKRAIGYYWHGPLPEEWGLVRSEFTLELLTASQYIEKANVGPADIAVTSAALVASGAGIITAAISGICAYLMNKNGVTIEIEGCNGAKVKVPQGTTREDLELYIKKAREIDAQNVIVFDENRPHSSKRTNSI